MKNYLVAERYARALAQAIESDAQLESVVDALGEIEATLESDANLRNLLVNPALSAAERVGIMNEVVSRVTDLDIVRRFMVVLLNRGRVALHADIVENFARKVDERLNRIGADVTTAIPMTAEQEDALRRALGEYTGKDVRIRATVAPEILGGVVARIGGTVIDGSLRSRLDRIRNALIAEEI